jgi:hypothetical protein
VPQQKPLGTWSSGPAARAKEEHLWVSARSARLLALPASMASALARTWSKLNRWAMAMADGAWLSQASRSQRQVNPADSCSEDRPGAEGTHLFG